MLTSSGKRLELEVKAIYEPPPFYPLLGSVSIARATFDSVFERPHNLFTFVNVPADPSDGTRRSLESALVGFPDTKVQTRSEWIAAQGADFDEFLQILYVLLGLSVVVSLFGMVNTLVLSMHERTRELGMFRAVGMTRRQTRRMVRHESVITALIGAAVGLPLGVSLAALVTRRSRSSTCSSRSRSSSSSSLRPWPPSPASWRRSCPPGGRRASTSSTRSSTSERKIVRAGTSDAGPPQRCRCSPAAARPRRPRDAPPRNAQLRKALDAVVAAGVPGALMLVREGDGRLVREWVANLARELRCA